jgi:hypothetical protein
MAFDVFISYPHKNKAIADAACAMLENAGVRCWIAPRDVSPGAEWAGSIVAAIARCKVMVLIFSSYANQSKQIHREVQQAFDKEVPVVPFRIENVTPAETLSYYLGPVHWLDALTPPLEDHLQRLTQSVQAFLCIEQPQAPAGQRAETDRTAALSEAQAEHRAQDTEAAERATAARRAREGAEAQQAAVELQRREAEAKARAQERQREEQARRQAREPGSAQTSAPSIAMDEQRERRAGWNWWYLLFLIQFIAVLWPSFYNNVEPSWAGIPFFYWYQLLWVIIGAVLTAVVYFATEE